MDAEGIQEYPEGFVSLSETDKQWRKEKREELTPLQLSVYDVRTDKLNEDGEPNMFMNHSETVMYRKLPNP